MVATKLAGYVNVTDGNGQKIGDWAVDIGNANARCKICADGHPINFSKGVEPLKKHSLAQKHKKAVSKISLTPLKQTSIEDHSPNGSVQGIAQRVRNFEIDLTRRLDAHNVSNTVIECLVDCLKTHLSDCKTSAQIVDRVKLSKSKAAYIAKHGIGKTYFEETIQLVQASDAFSIGFDESEVNKNHECQCMFNVSVPDKGIILRHYKTISLDGTDAETIVKTILDEMTDDQIPWKEKLVSPMTDGCNTMAGHKGGVKKKLEDLVPQLRDLGSCNDHHLSNAAKHAVAAFDSDVKEVLVNVYFDIGGAKGKGLKKRRIFQNLAEKKKRKLKAMKKFGETRFRSFRTCISPMLYNWETLYDYYNTVERPTDRQTSLKKFFIDQEFMSNLKCEFIMAATKDINDAINFFEGRTTKIHLVREKMESVLRTHLRRFMKQTAVYDVDEDGTLTKKSGPGLLLVDTTDEGSYYSKKSVFIGQRCAQIIKDLNLTPSSPQLDFFYKKVFNFHRTMAMKLQEYFKKGLGSYELGCMAALGPENRSKVTTTSEIMHLAKSYSKIVDGISFTGMDQLQKEVELYQLDDAIANINKQQPFDSYWLDVAKLTEGEEEKWQVYEVLPRFAMCMGTAFNSGSEMERGFSKQTDIHRDPKRNRMTHETLDSHLQIYYGVESEESKSKCETCIIKKGLVGKSNEVKTEKEKLFEKKICTCHCKYATISNAMQENCRNAWREAESASKKDEEEEASDPPEDSDERERRLDIFKKEISKRITFYENMKPIYLTPEEKKMKNRAEKLEKLKRSKPMDDQQQTSTNKNKKKNGTSSKQSKLPAVSTRSNLEDSSSSKSTTLSATASKQSKLLAVSTRSNLEGSSSSKSTTTSSATASKQSKLPAVSTRSNLESSSSSESTSTTTKNSKCASKSTQKQTR